MYKDIKAMELDLILSLMDIKNKKIQKKKLQI